MSYGHAKQLRAAILREIEKLRPNFMITHSVGHPIRPTLGNQVGRHPGWKPRQAEALMEDVHKFYDAMFSDCYGEGWRQKHDFGRIAYGFVESEKWNPHYHVLAKLDGRCAAWIDKYGKSRWAPLANRGQLDIDGPLRSQKKVRKYCTKRLTSLEKFEHTFVF